MQYGSVFCHGAYLGPDYTADYLRRAAERVRDFYGGPASDAAARKTIEARRHLVLSRGSIRGSSCSCDRRLDDDDSHRRSARGNANAIQWAR